MAIQAMQGRGDLWKPSQSDTSHQAENLESRRRISWMQEKINVEVLHIKRPGNGESIQVSPFMSRFENCKRSMSAQPGRRLSGPSRGAGMALKKGDPLY